MGQPDYVPRVFPISIKGVVVRDEKVLLLKNEREEWELPGGRIKLNETPEECVVREIAEETLWKVTVGSLLDTWIYYIDNAKKHVFIVTYGCHAVGDREPALSHEHKEIRLFEEHDVPELTMPEGYKRSVATWYARSRKVAPELVGKTAL